jgi:hypothetical protein
MIVLFNPSSGKRVGVPYSMPEYRPSSQCHGYVDLKSNPEDIKLLPEIKSGFGELRRMLILLNGRRSLFQTIGCDVSFGPSDTPIFKRKLTSWFNVVYEPLDWNQSPGNFEGLFRSCEEFIRSKGGSPDTYGVEFSIGYATFNDHRIDEHSVICGFHVCVWNHGYGKDSTSARREWAKGINIIYEFFEREIVAHPSDQFSGLRKVSVRKSEDLAS